MRRIEDASQGTLVIGEPFSDWKPWQGALPHVDADVVAVDTETKDEGLSSGRGPGWAMGAGYLCGVSVAWNDQAIYIPIRHPETECREQSDVVAWVSDIFRRCRIVMHNAPYDLGWLWHAGNRVMPERLDDTQAMAVMLDENRMSYSLDNVCAWRGIKGKDESLLRAAAAAYGTDPKSGLYKLPGRHVGPYAEQDALATLHVARDMIPALEAEDVYGAYRTEMALMPVVHDMRVRGIRISTKKAETAQARVRGDLAEVLTDISGDWGRKATMGHLRSPDALGDIFGKAGVETPKTPKTGKPSVQAEWLEQLDHPLGAKIRKARQLDDLAEKFIGTYILGFEHRGRLHPEVHQLRDGDSGTRTYRFSYSNPPLQQMPSRGALAHLIRGIFLPEDGELWAAPDFSQQEPRLAVHFSALLKLKGSADAVEYYATNENADFHTMVAELTGLPRSSAKTINLGLMYGMGVAKLAHKLGVSVETATEWMDIYHSRVPWVRGLTRECQSLAGRRGYIRLLDNARCRWDLWQRRSNYGDIRMVGALPRDKAEETWPDQPLERAFTQKAMNRLVQGSAARQTKLAMIECHREGLLPLIQMHDEIGLSAASDAQGQRAAQIMREVVKLRVPVRVDLEYGQNWGNAKHSDWTVAKETSE